MTRLVPDAQSTAHARDPRTPVVAAWGMGVDSTAMIIEWVARGHPLHVALAADPGAERPETLAFVPIFRKWMDEHGIPNYIVRYKPKRFKNWPPYYTIIENCLTNGTLPSISFGVNHTCSLGPACASVLLPRREEGSGRTTR